MVVFESIRLRPAVAPERRDFVVPVGPDPRLAGRISGAVLLTRQGGSSIVG